MTDLLLFAVCMALLVIGLLIMGLIARVWEMTEEPESALARFIRGCKGKIWRYGR